MKLPSLTVIEASAGTGKTFALVTHLLKLIFNGVKPERVVALTFSRMAAGEIFNSFIERLSKAANNESVALEESARLNKILTSQDFANKLREVISHQHLSLIGTLDSFMMRIVRMIPLELGLEGEISVMSEYRSPVERMKILGDMMSRESDDAKAIFRQAFLLALGSSGAMSFLESFSKFINSHHTMYRDYLEKGSGLTAWGDPNTIWGSNKPSYLDVSINEIRKYADCLSSYIGKRGAETFISSIKDFNGVIKTVPKCMTEDPLADEVVQKMNAWKIALALKETQGVFLLMSAYEAAYASKVRSRGLITFDDLPRLLNSLPNDIKLPLEYRMDAQFDHWALDEFQDTSHGQWKALKNLLGEATDPNSDKSVFIVGDRKQSIYEWRGGDVEILANQVKKAQEKGNLLVALDESYRYVSVISQAINNVFNESVVQGVLNMDNAPESAKWKCRDHISHNTDFEGFVQVIEAKKKKAKGSSSISDFFEIIENALNTVKPWERGISTAILVRKNSIGEAILAYLKSKGINKVVFEGESAVSDCPILSAMINLVKLAEHSSDDLAYSHIKYSPIAEALYPDGLPNQATLSALLLEDFTRVGMVRKFRDVREALKTVENTWNDFAESRFGDFIKCAAEFEEIRDASMRLSDFAEFIEHKTRRDFAESGMIRIMTMHQSKGLGFDWVIIPFYEPEKLISEKHVGPLTHINPDWVIENPGSSVALSDPQLAKAEIQRRQVQIYNALCLDYVAMTRAKIALTIILHPQNQKPPKTPEKFSDLIRLVGLKTMGDDTWYTKIKTETKFNDKRERSKIVRSKRLVVKKLRPSESFYAGLRGDILFSENFFKAAARGSEAHKKYESIDWIEESKAKNEFEHAFVKPIGFSGLWREKSYELFIDNKWESGQFDRVVFISERDKRSAIIYDFKTNIPHKNESEESFVERMRITYSSQMKSYKKALELLSGISSRSIETKLLLETIGKVILISK